ncbi:hypothetical protein [Flavobacterium sp. PL02]|uniref:hypothetical protein n=1 Tax=Flavobacterium sp. PL02 TaxID=3088354 RepID=UPI002B226278|nr:hypothetical protein [Flavobacterium sp. PL02]MEA9412715.1 hypothetical protein [Flavobacterium sp. PL02]
MVLFKTITLLSVVICLVSCKEELKNTDKNIEETKFKELEITIDFPDTVYVGTYYNGKINYKNDLDTITTKLLDTKKNRFIQFVFSVTKDINQDDEHFKKIDKDTFIAETNRMIPLYNMRFNKAGIRYINGIITDEVSITNVSKNKKGELMSRVITDEFRVTHKVVVVEEKEMK